MQRNNMNGVKGDDEAIVKLKNEMGLTIESL